MSYLYRKDPQTLELTKINLAEVTQYQHCDPIVQNLLREVIDFNNNCFTTNFTEGKSYLTNLLLSNGDALNLGLSVKSAQDGPLAGVDDPQLKMDALNRALEIMDHLDPSPTFNDDIVELKTFNEIVAAFRNKMAHTYTSSRGEQQELILDELTKIQNDVTTSEKKMAKLSSFLVQEYRELMLSFGGERSGLTVAIRQFCSQQLKLNLPEKLKRNQQLSLASLILDVDTDGLNHITTQFAAMIGKPYTQLTTLNGTAEAVRHQSTLKLSAYISQRGTEGDSNFHSFFSCRRNYNSASKIAAATKLMDAVKAGKLDVGFTPNEITTLLDGRLGKLVRELAQLNDVLPQALKNQVLGVKHQPLVIGV